MPRSSVSMHCKMGLAVAVAISLGIASPAFAGEAHTRPMAARPAASCPGFAGVTGANPSYSAVAAILEQVAAEHDIPPQVLKAVAYKEGWDNQTNTHWRQFHQDGTPIVSGDCGIGIMQLTGGTAAQFDLNRLASDVTYNIEAGAKVLDDKWNTSNSSNPAVIGDDDRSLIENWYYPIYLYNGASGNPSYPDSAVNDIRDPQANMPAVAPWAPAIGFTRPQEVIPGFSLGQAFQARANNQFITYNGSGTITGTYAGTVHPWAGGSPPPTVTYPAGSYGPDGTNGGFSFNGPPQYWYSGSPYGLAGHMYWTHSNGSSESNGATWAPPGLQANITYQVSAYIPRSYATANAHYTVTDGNGSATSHVVDQANYYDQYVSLGTFSSGSNATISVHLGDAGDASGATVVGVDAMRFLATGPVTVTYPAGSYGPDSASGGFAFTGPSQFWYAGAPYGLANHMYWTYSNGATESNGATWAPPSLLPNIAYRVAAYIPQAHATANAHYTVTDGYGTQTQHVIAQANYNDEYVDLGYFGSGPGGSIGVHLTDAGDAAGATKVGVDALKFVPIPGIAVTRTGSGHGTVTSSPAGIACGATCHAAFSFDATVTLTAKPRGNSRFVGWSGSCAGTSRTCTVSMTGAKAVLADFESKLWTLTVGHDGRGRVSSAPAGIRCGKTCGYAFRAGTKVRLTPHPHNNWRFAHWTGACSGKGRCTVTINHPRSAGAKFHRVHAR